MQERYIHLERINNGVLRVMAIGDRYQINDFLRLLRGHGYLICTDVSEHGHRVRRTQVLDDVVEPPQPKVK